MYNNYLLVYLLTFGLYFFFELYLISRQLRAANLQQVPADIAAHFPAAKIKEAQAYSIAKIKLALANHLYSNLFLLLVVISGFLGLLQNNLKISQPDSALSTYFYLIVLMLIFKIISIPVELYSTFSIEQRFGFNKTSGSQWVKDQLISLALMAVLLAPLVFVLVNLIAAAPQSWWIWAFLFVFTFQLVLLYLFPAYIAPLFNKFEPLKSNELREKIFGLSGQLDFPLSEVFEMDGSKRSSHGNAYFTGFGKNQRIVLFDTIIASLSQRELIAVLAHEIGHKKLKHLLKTLALQSLLMFGIFALMFFLYQQPGLHLAFGFNETSPLSALAIFTFLFSPILYFLTPLFNLLSRRFEYQADDFARAAVSAEKSDGQQPLKLALINLTEQNLGNLSPDPLYSFFHHSHPTLSERVRNLERI